MNDLLRNGLKLSHIRLLAALLEQNSLSAAADSINITQPAASRLSSELKGIMGTTLYERSGRGIELTQEGNALAKRAARMLQEIELAGREIGELRSGISGQVRVGSVTGPAVEFLLPAIRSFRMTNPNVTVGIDVGTSDQLMPQLMSSRLDFAIARRPSHLPADEFIETPLATEPVVFAARTGHPLDGREDLTLDDMMRFDWVLPFEDAILRTSIERALRGYGLGLPKHILSTSSFLITLIAVAQTNAIAPVAASVANTFLETGVTILPASIAIEVETYSHFQRSGTVLTPAAQILSEQFMSSFRATL